MDYLNVGSNGFAQVGDPDYFEKNRVEMRYLLNLIREKFPIPDRLKGLCYFKVKSFPHEFGTYHEVVLMFSKRIHDLEDSEDENDQELFDFFWNWFNDVECFDLESDEINETIKSLYYESLDRSKAEHLSLKQA